MLKAAKSKWFERLFAVYDRNLFRRRFNSLKVKGLGNLANNNNRLPLLIYASHVSWWDGLFAFEISRKALLDAYVMMEERQLRKLQAFRLLGAFSVVREDAREAHRSVVYASSLLQADSSRALWIFPQGEIFPVGKRPITFYEGAAAIAEKAGGCFAVPVAFRYEFAGEFKPEAFARVGPGEPLFVNGSSERSESTRRMESVLEGEMDRLAEEVADRRLEEYLDLI